MAGRLSSNGRLGTVVAAVALHGLAVWLLSRHDESLVPATTRMPLVIGLAIAGLLVTAALVPPQRSHDVWAYVAYGRMVSSHHVNPYEHRPQEFAETDQVIARMDPQWLNARAVYGPAFVVISAVGAAVSGSSALLARLFHQCLGASAVCMALMLLRRRGSNWSSLFFLGANPAVIGVVNGGHGDLLVGLALLAGVLSIEDRRFARAGAFFGAAALVKLVALFPIVAIGIWGLRRIGIRSVAKVAMVTGSLVTVSYLVVGGVSAVEPLRAASRTASRASIWSKPIDQGIRRLIAQGLRGVDAGAHVRDRASAAAGVLVLVWALFVGFRGRHRFGPATVGALAGLGYLLLGIYALPWYVAWIVPVVAMPTVPYVVRLAVQAQVAILLIAYVERPGTPPGSALTRTLTTTTVPRLQLVLAIAVLGLVLARRYGPAGARAGTAQIAPSL